MNEELLREDVRELRNLVPPGIEHLRIPICRYVLHDRRRRNLVPLPIEDGDRPICLAVVAKTRWGPGGHDSPFFDRCHPLIPG